MIYNVCKSDDIPCKELDTHIRMKTYEHRINVRSNRTERPMNNVPFSRTHDR